MDIDEPYSRPPATQRLYVGGRVQLVKWLNNSSAASDAESSSRPYVSTLWAEDSQAHVIMVSDLIVTPEDSPSGFSADPHHLHFIQSEHRTTGLAVAQPQPDTSHVLVAGSDGSIGRLRLKYNPFAREDESALELLPGDTVIQDNYAMPVISPWLKLHAGAITAIDYQANSHNVLTVGQDGAIFVVQLSAPSNASGVPLRPYRAANGVSSYTQARWSDSHTFATTGIAGGLQLWDVRQPGRPARRSPLEWGHTGCGALDADHGVARQVHTLALHPSRPNLAASGSAGGSVAVWDLRFESRPLVLSHQQQRQQQQGSSSSSSGVSGDVWHVQFDVLEAAAASPAGGGEQLPGVLLCTEDGCMARAAAGPSATLEAEVLATEPSALGHFDADPLLGKDLLVVSGTESLLYLQR